MTLRFCHRNKIFHKLQPCVAIHAVLYLGVFSRAVACGYSTPLFV